MEDILEVVDSRCSPSLGKSHPENEDELEGVVEGEPVDGVDRGLDHSEECVGHPVLFGVSVNELQHISRPTPPDPPKLGRRR